MRAQPAAGRIWVAALAAVIIVTACSTGEGPPDGLGIELTLTGSTATVILTNHSATTIRVVRPTVTPNFVGFVVVDDAGNELPFLGPHPQLRPLGSDGFADLAPGGEVIATFDLEDLYDLEGGRYTVTAEYRNPAGGSHEGGSAQTFEPGEGPTSTPTELVVP